MSEQHDPIASLQIGWKSRKQGTPWTVCVVGLVIAGLALAYGYYSSQPQGTVVSLTTKALSIARSVDTRNGLDGAGVHGPSRLLSEGN